MAVGLLVVTMVLLGFWQLRRLDEKQDIKARIEDRQTQPAADVQVLVPRGAAAGDDAVEAVEQRRATATGTYADDDTFVVENRTYNGASGGWVLTPLVLEDGSAVVVNRGFLGFDRDGEIDPPAAPPGDVVVEGVLLESERRGRFGPTDPDAGTLEVLARVDLDARRPAGRLPRAARVPPANEQRSGGGHAAWRSRARRARTPGANPRPPPRLRRPVVHLHDHRGGRVRAVAATGRERRGADEAARAADLAMDQELEALLDAEA